MSNNSNIVLYTMRELLSASAAEVAEAADISVSSARRWLNEYVKFDMVTASPATGFSDSGRGTNVIRYALKPEFYHYGESK